MDSRSTSCMCNLPITKKALVHAYGLVHCSPSGKFPTTLLSSLAKNLDVNESWLRDFYSFAGIKSFLVFLRDYMFQLGQFCTQVYCVMLNGGLVMQVLSDRKKKLEETNCMVNLLHAQHINKNNKSYNFVGFRLIFSWNMALGIV